MQALGPDSRMGRADPGSAAAAGPAACWEQTPALGSAKEL